MAKFSLKSLFIKEDETEIEENPVEQEVEKESTTAFPEKHEAPNYEKTPNFDMNTPIVKKPVGGVVDNEVLDQVIEMYAKGFESLNQPGYDFFEFFKSVTSVDEKNPQVYTMAFQIAKTMAPDISKEKLLSHADYYIGEINGVHQKFAAQGIKKKGQLLQESESAKATNAKEMQQMEAQIAELKQQLADLEVKLFEKQQGTDPVSEKNNAEIKLIDEKLLANDQAKGVIVGQIETVKKGIVDNL